jgi:hypothetical protein
MPLTVAEKERVRYHLGYPAVQPAASINFGIPRPMQTAFLVESAMGYLLEEACDRVRCLVKTLDETECRIRQSQGHLAAARIGNLETRENEPVLLEQEYVRWAKRLADELGVPLYPYSARFQGVFGAGNIPVRG